MHLSIAPNVRHSLVIPRAARQRGGVWQRFSAHAAQRPRETEVLYWLARGKTNQDIADICGMKPRTVLKHVEHIFEKLGVETRAATAAWVAREYHDNTPTVTGHTYR